jgi:hypothetical protein
MYVWIGNVSVLAFDWLLSFRSRPELGPAAVLAVQHVAGGFPELEAPSHARADAARQEMIRQASNVSRA